MRMQISQFTLMCFPGENLQLTQGRKCLFISATTKLKQIIKVSSYKLIVVCVKYCTH